MHETIVYTYDAVRLSLLDQLPAEYRHAWQLRRLLSTMGNSPNESEAIEVLEALAQRDPAFLDEYDWWSALMQMGSEQSGLALLEALCTSGNARSRGGFNDLRFSEMLARAANLFPAIREEILSRYDSMPPGSAKGLIERVLGNLSDESVVLKLIHNYAATGRSFDQGLAQAVHNVAVNRRAAEEQTGWYEEFSVPLIDLRKSLFELFLRGGSETVLADRCLTYIDEQRDENGRPQAHPRHPHITPRPIQP